MDITEKDILTAIKSAAKERKKRRDFAQILANKSEYVHTILSDLSNGSYISSVSYRKLTKINNNGKVRQILQPDAYTLILQHLIKNMLLSYYTSHDPLIRLNCKDGCGITAKNKRKSVCKRLKHIYYDYRKYNYAVIIDQRKCYEHITPKTFRKAMKYIGIPKWLNDFAVNICFSGNKLPIGTPTSPLVHHIVMLRFDLWLTSICPAVCYADDNFCLTKTKEDAQALLWRIKNFWWYELGIRAKRHTAKVISLNNCRDFCGYIFHRNTEKSINNHNKGYVSVRRSIVDNAHRSKERNYPCYFGILSHADTFGLLMIIEKNNMKLSKLTEKIKINRKMDAVNIQPKELADNKTVFNIFDYELRKDNKGNYNWIKCLIGFPELDSTGTATGRMLAREFHGNYSCIIEFIALCEKEFGGKANLLPLEEMEISNSCGYIFKGSTNMLEYINN